MKHWWHTETCCRIFKIRIVPFSTSALNRTGGHLKRKRSFVQCLIFSIFLKFYWTWQLIVDRCMIPSICMQSWRDRRFPVYITRRVKATPRDKKKKIAQSSWSWCNAIWRCCNSATFYYTYVLIVLFIFNVYGRTYTPPEREKKYILDSSLFIQIKHTLIGKGVYLFYINNQTKIYTFLKTIRFTIVI